MPNESDIRRYRRAVWIDIAKLIISAVVLLALILALFHQFRQQELNRAAWAAQLEEIESINKDMIEIRHMIVEMQLKQREDAMMVSRGGNMQRITAEEIKQLAGVVHAEAKGEPQLGKMLVAKVALNRLRRNPGLSLHDVLTKPNQFAAWEQYGDSDMMAVHQAMADTKYNDLAGFHNPKTATNPEAKEHKVLLKVGNHVFW